MIKVCQFLHGFKMGGAENIVRMYACELNKNIFDVSVVCYDGYESPYLDELSDKGVNVIDIGRNA